MKWIPNSPGEPPSHVEVEPYGHDHSTPAPSGSSVHSPLSIDTVKTKPSDFINATTQQAKFLTQQLNNDARNYLGLCIGCLWGGTGEKYGCELGLQFTPPQGYPSHPTGLAQKIISYSNNDSRL